MVVFHSYVSLPEGNHINTEKTQCFFFDDVEDKFLKSHCDIVYTGMP